MLSEREAALRLQQQQQQQQQGGSAGAVPPLGLVSNATHLRLPWEPLLTRDELLRGMAFYGTGRRLQRMARKLLDGQPVKIATLGGSITKGSGATGPEASYPARFFEALNASFPHRCGRWLAARQLGAVSVLPCMLQQGCLGMAQYAGAAA